MLCVALALVAVLWLTLAPAPTDRTPQPPQPTPKMHVSEVVPTDALFREPARAFDGDHTYWRVAIRDTQQHPVTGARVEVELVAPDGAVCERLVSITGNDGVALFRYALREGDGAGVYTVRVSHVSHAGPGVAWYDPGSNTAWSTSFSVNGTRRRGAPPKAG